MKEKRIISPHEARPESDYLKLERLSVKLGIPVPQVHLTVEVRKDGKLISSTRQRSRTWNRNFWNNILCQLTNTPGVATNFDAGYLSIKKTSGAVGAIAGGTWNFLCTGLVNNSTYGILVGIGTDAESFEGYVLSSLCSHGSGANQLVHAAHSALVQSYDAPTKKWTITIKRIFNNNSAADIVIAETALVFNMPNQGTQCMLNRDLLGATQTVAIGAQLTVSYDVTLTFPA